LQKFGGIVLEIGNMTINVGTPELKSSFTTNSKMLIEPFTFTLLLKNYSPVRLLTKLFKLIITIMYLCEIIFISIKLTTTIITTCKLRFLT